jgi:hypothetical protein
MAMTPEEHMLILQLYFKQQQAIRTLLNMLRSRDVLTTDDEQAFGSAQMLDVGSNAAIFDEAKRNYLKIAHSVEIQTGLETLPSPPLEWFRA